MMINCMNHLESLEEWKDSVERTESHSLLPLFQTNDLTTSLMFYTKYLVLFFHKNHNLLFIRHRSGVETTYNNHTHIIMVYKLI